MLLAGCVTSGRVTLSTQLPPVPNEFRTCFKGVVAIKDAPLTVGEVEALWKNDRVRAVATDRCGKRLVSWYETLRRTYE